ncbi:TRAF-like zinc-finger domain-containing protein [Ditylenchus destructor]|uniref:TRAF-like zinc-finger domain-containing protein n=1 Tax=Ditylenchus destructor TaxID=166010 RepID=A0AAD4N9U4_9BILA|nr:TRAF-like zinc-finger domain-containing protein [Ditylenchus destructor]
MYTSNGHLNGVSACSSHCNTCIRSDCGFAECIVEKCNLCQIRLHPCKFDDHLLICQKAHCNCPNFLYGCKAKMRRDRISAHLRHCPANVIVCNCIWTRKFMSKESKKALKLVAKGFATCPPPQHSDIDVRMALKDQERFSKLLQCRREVRKKFSHALVSDFLTAADFSETFSPSDSSEEEARETERKIQKKREPFAGCYLCKQDPGSQHLHVLGGINPINGPSPAGENRSPKTGNGLSMDPLEFYHQNSLFVGLSIDYYGTLCDAFGQRKESTCSILCNELIRRDELEHHQSYHGILQNALEDGIIKRCPMAGYGCSFSDFTMCPSMGDVRYNDYLGICVYALSDENISRVSFEEVPMAHILKLIEPYLDSASLHCLSATCSTVRNIIFNEFTHRSVVELCWVQQEDRESSHDVRESHGPKWRQHGYTDLPGGIVRTIDTVFAKTS